MSYSADENFKMMNSNFQIAAHQQRCRFAEEKMDLHISDAEICQGITFILLDPVENNY